MFADSGGACGYRSQALLLGAALPRDQPETAFLGRPQPALLPGEPRLDGESRQVTLSPRRSRSWTRSSARSVLVETKRVGPATDACSAKAKQVPTRAGYALSEVVPSERPTRLAGDDRLHEGSSVLVDRPHPRDRFSCMDTSTQPVAAASDGCRSGAISDHAPPGACSSFTVIVVGTSARPAPCMRRRHSRAVLWCGAAWVTASREWNSRRRTHGVVCWAGSYGAMNPACRASADALAAPVGIPSSS